MKALKICECGELMNRVADAEYSVNTGEKKVCWKCPSCGRTKTFKSSVIDGARWFLFSEKKPRSMSWVEVYSRGGKFFICEYVSSTDNAPSFYNDYGDVLFTTNDDVVFWRPVRKEK
ncbi:MAG: hypothetical protein MJY89_06025 [Bacteroidales bacterium]|nr:hypothetical protein [Bacteroidales bacterium]